MQLGSLEDRHLGCEVRRPSEAVHAESASRGHPRPPQGPVPDDAGAKQRGGVLVVEGVGEPVGVPLGYDGEVRMAAVLVPPG